jgi:hypothetical protein
MATAASRPGCQTDQHKLARSVGIACHSGIPKLVLIEPPISSLSLAVQLYIHVCQSSAAALWHVMCYVRHWLAKCAAGPAYHAGRMMSVVLAAVMAAAMLCPASAITLQTLQMAVSASLCMCTTCDDSEPRLDDAEPPLQRTTPSTSLAAAVGAGQCSERDKHGPAVPGEPAGTLWGMCYSE